MFVTSPSSDPLIHLLQLEHERILIGPPSRRFPVRSVRESLLDHRRYRQASDERGVYAYFNRLGIAKSSIDESPWAC